jgi:hypothetical protein
MLIASVPRRLRVRPSIQVAGTRVPARGFLLGVGVLFLGGMAVILGADLERTLWITGSLALIGLLLLEGRLWGRSTREVALIVGRHLCRPRRMRLTCAVIVLPPEAEQAPAVVVRRPRWQTEER